MRLRGVPYGEVVSRIGPEEGLHRDQELHRGKDQSSEAEPSAGEKELSFEKFFKFWAEYSLSVIFSLYEFKVPTKRTWKWLEIFSTNQKNVFQASDAESLAVTIKINAYNLE